MTDSVLGTQTLDTRMEDTDKFSVGLLPLVLNMYFISSIEIVVTHRERMFGCFVKQTKLIFISLLLKI